MNDRIQQLLADAPPWAREPAVQIGAAVVVALLLLWLLSRLFRSRPRAEEEIIETLPVEEYPPVVRPITPPPVTPPPPPIAEEPLIVPPLAEIAPDPVREPAPEPLMDDAPAPEPAPEPAPAPEPVPEPIPEPEPEPASPYIPEEAPEPAVMPIVVPEPVAEPEPVAKPEPVAEPAPVPPPAPLEPMAAAADDLTRMKGVGPRLADRLNSLGIASFAQIAALTPEDADALDARLGDFQGRIHRDRWIEQAGYLANGDITGFEEVFGRL